MPRWGRQAAALERRGCSRWREQPGQRPDQGVCLQGSGNSQEARGLGAERVGNQREPRTRPGGASGHRKNLGEPGVTQVLSPGWRGGGCDQTWI